MSDNYLEEQLIPIVLDKNAICIVFTKNSSGIRTKNRKGNHRWIEIHIDFDKNSSWPRLAYGDCPSISPYKLKRLPDKVVNLLAIVHRPFFEMYKKYIEILEKEKENGNARTN